MAAAITSFLLILTLIETSSNNINTELPSTSSSSSSSSSMYQIGAFFAIAIISFMVFVQIERKEKNPLVDLKLVLNKAILPANLIILIVGLSNFMVFQTIPILVRNPEPLGFGADAISTGSIQLPFCISFPNLRTNLRSHNFKVRFIETNNIWNNNYHNQLHLSTALSLYRNTSFS